MKTKNERLDDLITSLESNEVAMKVKQMDNRLGKSNRRRK